jgi:hypothetical protein
MIKEKKSLFFNSPLSSAIRIGFDLFDTTIQIPPPPPRNSSYSLNNNTKYLTAYSYLFYKTQLFLSHYCITRGCGFYPVKVLRLLLHISLMCVNKLLPVMGGVTKVEEAFP